MLGLIYSVRPTNKCIAQHGICCAIGYSKPSSLSLLVNEPDEILGLFIFQT